MVELESKDKQIIEIHTHKNSEGPRGFGMVGVFNSTRPIVIE